MDRYTVWQKAEVACLEILRGLLSIGYQPPDKRADCLTALAPFVDMLRVFLRLSFDVKAINQKKYVDLQTAVDEIGRMLGGWLKSVKPK